MNRCIGGAPRWGEGRGGVVREEERRRRRRGGGFDLVWFGLVRGRKVRTGRGREETSEDAKNAGKGEEVEEE